MNTELSSFPAAMMDYFGRNGKSYQDFANELKALTDADRAEFKAELKKLGYTKLI